MSVIEKSIMRTEAHFSENKEHRFLLRKEWDKTKKRAMVIMINPSRADKLLLDPTTMYVVNNLVRLDFGSVDMVNIFSKIDIKINSKANLEVLVATENDDYILKAAAQADYIIVAWGKIGETNKKAKDRQEKVLQLLEGFKEKIQVIEDNLEKKGYHPLAPQVRLNWNLKNLS